METVTENLQRLVKEAQAKTQKALATARIMMDGKTGPYSEGEIAVIVECLEQATKRFNVALRAKLGPT